MKWTDIAEAISSIANTAIALAALVISLRRKPKRNKRRKR